MAEPIFKYAITQDYTIPTGVAGAYYNGVAKPSGIGIHSSGNQNAGIDSEISFMTGNYMNAFTSAWTSNTKTVEIASTDYRQWGIGPEGNPYLVQIEMTEDKRLTDAQHLESIDRASFWGAVQLWYYGLKPSNAEGSGSGTVWTHNAVSHHLGGTNHVDPMAYLQRHGTNWTEMYNQIVAYYNLLAENGDTNRVVSIADKVGNEAVVKDKASEAKEETASKQTTPKPATGNTHTVQKGDTLYSIGKANNVSVDELKKLNGLSSNTLSIGQELKVKGTPTKDVAETYEVVKGDTLWGIGQAHNMTAQEIKDLNNLSSDTLSIGQTLKLKEGESEIAKPDTYKVKKGDTLWGISQKTGVSVADLKEFNGLDSNIISINQELKLDSTGVPAGKELQPYVGNEDKWSNMQVGDTVTIRKGATKWLNENLKQSEPMSKDFTGTIDTIKEIIPVKIGYSDEAYLLEKLGTIILQQDVVEPRETVTYTVQKGDTLYAIANKFGITVDELKEYNGLTSNIISVGQVLRSTEPDSKAPADVPDEAVEKEVQPVVEGTEEEAIELADNEVLLNQVVYVVTEK